MSTRHYFSSITPIFLAILISILLTNCASDANRSSSTIIEVYEVDEGADNNYAKGKLKYMEQESFKGNKLISKTIYNEDQTVKGKEVYSYTGNSKYPSGSKYYDGNGMIQSTYTFEYQDSLKVKSQGFEGEDGELLRIEGFNYDNKGNMVRKTIYNELQQKQRSFLFSHDDKGNEIKMLLLDANENQLLSETYEVVTINEEGEWLEKWGYRNDEIRPITFYHKKKSK